MSIHLCRISFQHSRLSYALHSNRSWLTALWTPSYDAIPIPIFLSTVSLEPPSRLSSSHNAWQAQMPSSICTVASGLCISKSSPEFLTSPSRSHTKHNSSVILTTVINKILTWIYVLWTPARQWIWSRLRTTDIEIIQSHLVKLTKDYLEFC